MFQSPDPALSHGPTFALALPQWAQPISELDAAD